MFKKSLVSDIDECASSADMCRHGYTCVNKIGSYKCTCDDIDKCVMGE